MVVATKRQPKKCAWKGCKKKHYDEAVDSLYPLEKDGVLDRDKYVGQWYEPWCILLSSYENHGVKEGRNTNVVEISNKDHYKTENHHVITCSAMQKAAVSKLKANLELMGWNLNHGLLNGICLPANGEDYIWHNLQPHLGSHPRAYTREVTRRLYNLNITCPDLCSEAQQDKLLREINNQVNILRKKILDWEIGVHSKQTLDKVKKNVKNSVYLRFYENPDSNRIVPDQSKLGKPSGRTYYQITIS